MIDTFDMDSMRNSCNTPNLHKLNIRKLKNHYIIFVRDSYKTREIFLNKLFLQGGSKSEVMTFTNIQDMVKVLNEPVCIREDPFTSSSLILESRVLNTTWGTFWRALIKEKDYTRDEFVALHPEYFI